MEEQNTEDPHEQAKQELADLKAENDKQDQANFEAELENTKILRGGQTQAGQKVEKTQEDKDMEEAARILKPFTEEDAK